MNKISLLNYGLPLFDGINPGEIKGLDLNFRERSLDPWEVLFNQEDSSREVYFLLSGALLAVYWTTEGREIIFSRFTIGSYLGELAALDGGERSLAVVARRSAKVLAIPQENFLTLFHDVTSLRTRIAQDLVARIRKLTARNLELTTFSVEQRVASFLIGLAMERGRLEVGGVLSDAPTHAEIAASIGANREMVSRTMTQLSRKGALRSSRQRIELLDPEILSEIV